MGFSTLAPSKMAYRAACALNNKGVALLRNGCFEHAHETLKDAVSAIKSVFKAEACKDELDRALERADRRMFALKHCRRVGNVEVLFCNPSLPPDGALIDSSAPQDSSLIMPIKLDLVDSDPDSKTPTIELSVILLNLGTASFLLSRVQSKQASSTQLLTHCYRYLSLALELSTRHSAEQVEETQACRLFVASRAIHCLLQVDRQSGGWLGGDRDRFQSMYDKIRSSIMMWRQGSPFLQLLSHDNFAPAA